MKNLHLYLLPFLLLFAILPPMDAQSPNGGSWTGKRGGAGGKGLKIAITGQVVGAESNSPLEYATVSFFTKKDSSLVTGGITDSKGFFRIDIRSGRFFAKIEFLSFETQFIENVSLNREKLEVDLGIISLSTNDEENTASLEYKDYFNSFPDNLISVVNRIDEEKERRKRWSKWIWRWWGE